MCGVCVRARCSADWLARRRRLDRAVSHMVLWNTRAADTYAARGSG